MAELSLSSLPQRQALGEVTQTSYYDASQLRCFRHILTEGGPSADPGLSGKITSLSCLGNNSVSPRMS